MNANAQQEHLKRIQAEPVRAAYRYLVRSFQNIGFECTPTTGVVRAVRVHDKEGRYVFSFIVNKRSLLFYLRNPALTAAPHLRALARRQRPDSNDNNGGEVTIPVRSEAEAQDLSLWLFPELPLP
jgi:hypothetical protein